MIVVHPSRNTLILSGELDTISAPDLQHLVTRVCDEGARKIVLDLMNVDFMDSAGVQAILASWGIARDHEAEFVLTPVKGAVRRALQVMGMLDVLPFARVAI